MALNEQDVSILRALGHEVAAIAALPAQQDTIRRWKALNGLKPERPMVMIDQVPWHEMEIGDELSPRVTDPFWRARETGLRRTLYQWRHMPVDMVVEPVIEVPHAIIDTGFGIEIREDQAVFDPGNPVVGHRYHDTIKTDEDLAKLRTPRISLDAEQDTRRREVAHHLFDGILEVRMVGRQPMFAPWDRLATWRGPEALLYDLVDRPAFIHRTMERLTTASLAMLDQLEELGLLTNYKNIHCTGAHAEELPAPGFVPGHTRPCDMWTAGMAQIFSTVSPAMHDEFEIRYANRWYERFGLVYYGCCEPLDGKMDIIRSIPHVRKISMSPWVDIARGASEIRGNFVFSRKPSPALLAVDNWSAEAVRRDLQDVMDCCDTHGCPLELILKDISTVRYEPQRLWEWAETAMAVVRA